MDAKRKPLSDLFHEFHVKFGENLKTASPDYSLAEDHEVRTRLIRHIGILLGQKENNLEHQKLISKYFDEIFGDMVCALYFAFIGLDNPARIILRRALELGLASVCYWDNPTAFWGWNSKNQDISFGELDESISSAGYLIFIESEGCVNYADWGQVLQSNTVHRAAYISCN